MKNKLGKYYSQIVFTAVIVLCILLISASIMLFQEYSDGLDSHAITRAEGYFRDTGNQLTDGIDSYLQKCNTLAEILATCQTRASLLALIQEETSRTEFSDLVELRFFEGGNEYDAAGNPFENTESEKVLNLVGSNEAACAGVLYDQQNNGLHSVAFYAPVKDSSLIDSVVLLYPLSSMSTLFDETDAESLATAELVAFGDTEGRIYRIVHDPEETVDRSTNLLDYLKEQVRDKATYDAIEQSMTDKKASAFSTYINDVPYIVTVNGAGENGGGMCVVGLYNASDIYGDDLTVVNTITGAMIVIFALVIIIAVFFMISQHRLNKKVHNAEAYNPLLDCYSSWGFQRASEEILKRHKVSNFALVAVEVKFFNNIAEHFGSEVSDGFLRHMKMVYSKALSLEEVMGYFADGQFYLLLHYRDKKALTQRLDNINYNVCSYSRLKKEKYSIKLYFGIYEIDRTAGETIERITEKAVIAKNSVSPLGTDVKLKFYEETLGAEYARNANLEARADFALENNEFVVFFQPKMNIAENRMDGCEALVRWYNAEENVYHSPASFLPLFEANGFIINIDKHVYRKVCEFIAESIKNGLPVYPTSINVSRVTASQENFLEYYIGVKKEFGIPDNFLTLEFTESFAYENYELLNSVVNNMHKNGFLCSIDDFGAGNSSYNILKQLCMDELKLDRFFISPGLSRERDNLLLKSVIDTAKQLKMKIVQEGVETEDDVQRLKELGCNVIQGYYYSKPLYSSDYIAFITAERNKKHIYD